MSTGRELFEKVVEQTGLAAFIGPGTVQRALVSAHVVSIDDATGEDYRRALPHLRGRMAVYLKPDVLDRQLRCIEELLRR